MLFFPDRTLNIVRIKFSKPSFLNEFQLYVPDSWSQYNPVRIRLFQRLLSQVGSDVFSFFLPSICFLFLILVISMLSFLDSCHKYTPWESNFQSIPPSMSFSCIFLILVPNMAGGNPIFQSLLPQGVSDLFPWFLSSICSLFMFPALNIPRENQILQASLPQGVSAILSWYLYSICFLFLILFPQYASFSWSCPQYTPWESNFPRLLHRRVSAVFS